MPGRSITLSRGFSAYTLLRRADLALLRDVDRARVMSSQQAHWTIDGVLAGAEYAVPAAYHELLSGGLYPRDRESVEEMRRRLVDAVQRGQLVLLCRESAAFPGRVGPDPAQESSPPTERRPVEPLDWIGLQLEDQSGNPVPHRPYRIITPDKVTLDGVLDAKGRARIESLVPGECTVYCPYIAPRGDVVHVVKAGEHPSGIARAYGYEDVDAVWGHGQNADLRGKRGVSHVLAPGDAVFIPDASEVVKPASRPTGKTHVFTINLSPLKLRVRLVSPKGKPIDGAACTLDGAKVTSDGDGNIELPIDKLTETSSLVLDGVRYSLQIGHLNPMEDDTPAGWRARLFNMGYLCDPELDTDDDELKFAIADFQAEHKLDVSGKLDEATKSKVKEVYGS